MVVPDGVLHTVPFAALIRSEDRRFLIEEHSIAIAPSLTTFVSPSASAMPLNRSSSVLVVGNPLIEGVRTGLADLPEADAEARQVANLYRGADTVLGPVATKEVFLRDAGRHQIVHFAGHAVANEQHPELSRLLLAGRDEATGSLFAREIRYRQCPRRVLSCSRRAVPTPDGSAAERAFLVWRVRFSQPVCLRLSPASGTSAIARVAGCSSLSIAA